jgi:rod shape-determining protein MreC
MAGPGRGGRRRYVLVLIVLASVTLITLDQRQGDSGPVGELGRFAHRVVAPVSDASSAMFNPISDWFDGVEHAGSFKRDNARLRRELEAERITAERAQSAIAENKLLTQLNGQPFLDSFKSVTARVITFSPGNFDQTVTLDRGSEKGIKSGMPVVAGDGLVGRVTQVWKGGCDVLLLDDPSFAVGVRMAKHRNVGPAAGQAGQSSLSVRLSGPLPKGEQPQRGELAETSGLQGSTFPPGIPVGTVMSLAFSDAGLSIDVAVDPLVDVTNLEFVKVLLWTVGSPVPPPLQATTTVPTTTTTTTTTTTVPGATTTVPSGVTTTSGP